MKLRNTRHTINLKKTKDFYTKIIGLDLLGEYNNRENYDGIYLGKKNQDWILEFTVNKNFPYSEFDENDYLIFYPENIEEYEKILNNIKKYDIITYEPNNPYWKKFGIMIKDPDRFGIIINKFFNDEFKSLWTYKNKPNTETELS